MSTAKLPAARRGSQPQQALGGAERPTGSSPEEQIALMLAAGKNPGDRLFDSLLPGPIRCVSCQHWTPLIVVLRVARWLRELNIRSLVDLGSGSGKFGVAVALATDCQVVGIEQRSGLVHCAVELAERFGMDRNVRFQHGRVGRVSIPLAQAYYLYNPYGENLYGPEGHVDETVELTPSKFEDDVEATEILLEKMSVGTYVIKYNGFGGRMPVGFRAIDVDREMPSVLRLWRREHL